ncbi:MAG: hydrogenase maturation protease [Candidatus Heimdallarchaeota archaeon]|nr:hydrogenase maturation protease [Candidatus Heimdallarchaeota archaeon]
MTQQFSDNYLVDRLNKIMQEYQRIAFIGLGNPIKGDDAVGIYISDKLIETTNSQIPYILSCYHVPANYLGKIVTYNPDYLIFLDAIFHPDFSPGDIVIISPSKIKQVDTFTTHYQGYETIIKFLETELGKQLDYIVLGINVTEVKLDDQISIEIENSADVIISSIEKVITHA